VSEFVARLEMVMPEIYIIEIKEDLDKQWTTWFEGLTIYHNEKGNTILRGSIVDQAALYGILIRLRDLGLTLISVNRQER
jgi:hypothetical protein